MAGRAHRRVKRAHATAGLHEQGEGSSDEEGGDVPGMTGSWSKKDPRLVGSKIPPLEKLELPEAVVAEAANYTAYDYYKLFQPDSFVEQVLEQSRLYGGQKDLHKAVASVNMNTYRCTEAVLLLSGYHSVPRRRMLWERQPDCFNKLVADSIRRTQMDAVLSCLHFRDNADTDDDGYYKVIKFSLLISEFFCTALPASIFDATS